MATKAEIPGPVAQDDADVALPRSSEEMLPELRARLDRLDKGALVDLILREVEGDYDKVQGLIFELSVGAASKDGSPVETRVVAQRVRNLLGTCPKGRGSWTGDDIDDEAAMAIREIVEAAVADAGKGDGRNAVAILRTVLCAMADARAGCPYDYEGDLDGMLAEAAAAAARVVLRAEIPAAEREDHAGRLAPAVSVLGAGPVRNAVGAVRRALESGWDAPWVDGILKGSKKSLPAWDADRMVEEAALLPARYEVLGHADDAADRGRLAMAFEDHAEVASAYADAGRTDEAAAYAKARLGTPAEAMRIARELWSKDLAGLAVDVGAWGLALPGSGAPTERSQLPSLAHWVREASARTGNVGLARKAALVAFAGTMRGEDFSRGKALAGDAWAESRAGYLAVVGRMRESDAKLAILVEEGEYDRAIAVVGDASHWDRRPAPVIDLMRKVSRTHPDWVIRTAEVRAYALLRAEKSSSYADVARWLERSAVAHRAAGRHDEWTSQIEGLIKRYSNKSSLRPMLEALRNKPATAKQDRGADDVLPRARGRRRPRAELQGPGPGEDPGPKGP